MSDLAKDLLTQYYGLGAETSGIRFISIHQSVENVRKEEEKQVIEQTPFHEENVTAEESQKVIDDAENIDATGELIRQPTEIFNNLDDEYDPNGSLNVLNIDLGTNITCDIFECEPSTLREGFQHDIANNTPRSTADNREMEANDVKDFNENEINLELIKDNNSNDVLEDRGYVARKTPKSYHLKSLTSKKEPVCNQTYADFCNTGLKQFPNDILTSFPYLRMLYLSNNNLTELLDEIFSTLKYLEWLDVRNNEISFLPLTIKWHPCLETILLQGNKLESLPLELCTLPNLKTLQVTQNPLILPPEGIVASGSTATLEFLRIEWNNAHPEDPIEPKKNQIEPKLSTILCYQSPRKNKKKIMPLKNIYHNRVVSTRERRKLYKPSNRCKNRGTDIQIENRVLWHAKAREFFAKQAAIVQKMKDENTLKDWRQDKRSYNKAMEKSMKRNEDDIPFAFDLEDYASVFKQSSKTKNLGSRRRNKEKHRPPADINKKLNELLESINKLEISTTDQTPRSKQFLLKEEIEKILHFQNEIHNLQKYNQLAMVPLKN